jgi:hypothetical protein
MFQRSAVRSREKIIKGLLTRAFERGGQEEQEKMELLIDWRLAACNYSNKKAALSFRQDYKLSDMKGFVSTGSRGLDAFNWISAMEGRSDTLLDADFERKIKNMEVLHHWVRFFRNSEIQVDLDALKKAQIRSNPRSPIMVDLPALQLCQRDPEDAVYARSLADPSYMSPAVKKGGEVRGSSAFPLMLTKPKFH